MVKHALVIYNPVSKSQVKTEEWIGQLVAELNKEDQYLVSFFPTEAHTTPDDLIPLIQEPLDLIIAGGGDGTLRFALAAVAKAKSEIPVATFPMGTGNVMARNIGIVEQHLMADPLKHAYEYIKHGVPMKIDMGMMNGEFFAGMAGVGPIADAFMLPAREEKTQNKLKAYFKSLLTSIARPRRQFKITTSGGSFKVEAAGVFLSNVEDLGIGKQADIGLLSDGLLDLHVMNPENLEDFIQLTKRYGAGDLSNKAPDTVFRVKEAVVELIPRRGVRSSFQSMVKKLVEFITREKLDEAPRLTEMPCMIDGDLHSTTPMRVTVIPKAVTILVPQEIVEGLDVSHSMDSSRQGEICGVTQITKNTHVHRADDRAAS